MCGKAHYHLTRGNPEGGELCYHLSMHETSMAEALSELGSFHFPLPVSKEQSYFCTGGQSVIQTPRHPPST